MPRLLFLVYLAVPTYLSAQCELPKQLVIPPADRAKFNSYGNSSDSFNDYLVVGEAGNDSLEFESGLIHVYKLNASNLWNRMAKLSPSDPQEFGATGSILTMNATTIVTIGNHFDDAGNNNQRLYFYVKDANGEWNTGTESYKIILDSDESVTNLELSENYLAVTLFKRNQGNKLYMYEKQSGTFSFLQTINAPLNNFADDISMTDELFVASSSYNGDGITLFGDYGAAVVYERTGTFWSSTPVATLLPSDRTALRPVLFRGDIILTGNSILVSSILSINQESEMAVYVYEKPITGWVGEITEVSQISNGTGYPYEHWSMAGSDDYLFLPNANIKSVAVLKKTGSSWQQNQMIENILLPPSNQFYSGSSFTLTDNHFIVGQAPFGNKESNIGLMIDYTPNGTWENGILLNQKISETSINATFDFFGKDIAVKGDIMAIGADGDEDNGRGSGAVYMYQLVNEQWVQLAKVTAPMGHESDYFGKAVALSDNNLFIGAPGTSTYNLDGTVALRDVGTVYVYKRNGSDWLYESQLYPPLMESGQLFGQEITYNSGHIAIGEFIENSTDDQGLVHIFKENSGTWVYCATLSPSDLPSNDSFGRSIAMDDSIIVIGTGFVRTSIYTFMKVYVYNKKGTEWISASEDAQLFPAIYDEPTAWTNEMFGYSVALYDNQIVVGAPGYSTGGFFSSGFNNGTAYIFTKPIGGWKGTIHETAQFFPSNPSKYNSFGVSVAMDENNIYVGAPHTYFYWNYVDNINNADGHVKPGTVYRYIKSHSWKSISKETEKIVAVQPEAADMFGAKVVLENGHLFVAAPFDDTDAGYKTGSVLAFPQKPVIVEIINPCIEDGDVVLSAFPAGGTWSVKGLPDQSSNSFNLPVGPHEAIYRYLGCNSEAVNFDVISSGLSIQETNAGQLEKCANASKELVLKSNAGIQNYSWFYKASETDSYTKIDQSKDSFIAAQTGFYYVSIKTTKCNPHTEYFQVFDQPVIEVKLETPKIICSDDVLQLTAMPLGGTWSTPANTLGEVDPTKLTNGKYKIDYSIISSLGCRYGDDVEVVVDKLDTPQLDAEGTRVCMQEPVTLNVSNKSSGVEFQWYDTIHPGTSLSSSEQVDINTPGTYYVTAFKSGCTLSSDPIQIQAKPDSLFIPNVITPNGDNKNDFFEVKSEGLKDFEMFVINRHGREIYSTKDANFKWYADDVSSAVYFWQLQYRNCSNEKVELKGLVHIVH